MWRPRPVGCFASAATIRATNDCNDRRRHQVAAERDGSRVGRGEIAAVTGLISALKQVVP
jgi:hypothetical protein